MPYKSAMVKVTSNRRQIHIARNTMKVQMSWIGHGQTNQRQKVPVGALFTNHFLGAVLVSSQSDQICNHREENQHHAACTV
jgi:hypothetical protein